ncbi:polyprenyl diphosphate synthase [Streptomyces sp. NPDC050433]|uniref:polyprenyl diphosphate synthase n=1 Tax=Streptomyces sp. NPDC050433 TaxID=3365615 RepID=UPI00379442A6
MRRQVRSRGVEGGDRRSAGSTSQTQRQLLTRGGAMSFPVTTDAADPVLSSRSDLHHLGVILDGNRRWAKANGVSLLTAYHRGATRFGELLTWCHEAGIPYVSAWAMSADNLSRPGPQIAPLLDAVLAGLRPVVAQGHWRLRLIGELHLLPARQRDELQALVDSTAHAVGGRANIALAYDGRLEIISALRRLLAECVSRVGDADVGRAGRDITEDRLARYLYTADQPDIDLVIRTSGEKRLSGFMPWQTAQAELVFCEQHWPDFSKASFARAIDEFALRVRRFGL